MHGIEKLKGALAFAINLAEAIDKRLDDGKISFFEGIAILPNLKDLPAIIKDLPQIKAEFNDLDTKEQDEILDFIKGELDLRNDDVEGLVEQAFDTLVSLGNLIVKIGEVSKS